MGFSTLAGCSVVLKQILRYIDDLDLKNLSKADDSFRQILDESLPSSVWHSRAVNRYSDNHLGRKLIQEIHITDLSSYIDFLQKYNDLLTITYPAELRQNIVFTTAQLSYGPGTEKILPVLSMTDTQILFTREIYATHAQNSDLPLFNQNLTYPKTVMALEGEQEQIVVNGEDIETEDNRPEIATILFKDYILSWSTFGAQENQSLFKLIDPKQIQPDQIYISDRYFISISIEVISGYIVVIGNELTDEDGLVSVINRHMQFFVHTDFNQFQMVKDIISNIEEFPIYSLYSNQYVHLQTPTKKIKLIDTKELPSGQFDTALLGTRLLDFDKIIDKSYLKSSILEEKCREHNVLAPEVKWAVVKSNDRLKFPLFILAFGCRNKFVSNFANITFRDCRSAAFATFLSSDFTKLRLFFLPIHEFDMVLHDGFVQVLPKNNQRSFGKFYKLVNDIHGNSRITELDLNLDSHYPDNSHTKCMHQIRGKSTLDKLVILLWTWPSRSAADNSITNKLLTYNTVMKESSDSDDDDGKYDLD